MKKGFTIIEVSLVLAIAGLIFMMVFIAVPGLQTTRRDAARREMVSNFVQQIKNYQRNNDGALPTISSDEGKTKEAWAVFAEKYLGNDLKDPDGSDYTINTIICANDKCEINFDSNNDGKHRMIVVKQAKCDGDEAIRVSNPRKAAVLYQLERGTACGNT